MSESDRSPSQDDGGLKAFLGKFGWLLPFHTLHHVYLLALPPLFPLLRDSLVPSYTLLGLLRGVFSGGGFAIILAGRLADEIGEKTAIVLGFIMVPLFLLACASAPSYLILLLFVGGYGLARCMYHPAGLSYLSKAVDSSVHGKAIGLHESVGSLGSGLAFATLGWVGHTLGWRGALVVIAFPGLFLSMSYVLLNKKDLIEDFGKRREKSRSEKNTDQEEGIQNKDLHNRVFGVKQREKKPFWLQMAGKVTGDLGRQGFVVFLASFLTSVYGMSAGLAGGLIGLSYLGSFGGNLIGGNLAEMLGLVKTYVSFTLLGAAFMLIIAVFNLPLYALIPCLLLYFLSSATRNPADKALLAERSHHQGRGAGYGSYFTFGRLGTFVSGPLFGVLIETVGMRSTYLLAPTLMALAALIMSRISKYRVEHS
ncbi:MAG: MFS transporter [Candidatus Acetothermia bacterium]